MATNPSLSQSASKPRSVGTHGGEASHSLSEAVGQRSHAATEHLLTTPAKDILQQLKDYAQEKPDVAVCWCFAIGIVVGWKLRS